MSRVNPRGWLDKAVARMNDPSVGYRAFMWWFMLIAAAATTLAVMSLIYGYANPAILTMMIVIAVCSALTAWCCRWMARHG